MLRRLGFGVLALMALGLVTSRPAAAQDQGMGMGMQMSDSGSSGMSMPGMGMGSSDSCSCGTSMPGMSMSGMGMMGMGMGMSGMGMMGMGMGMSGMGMGAIPGLGMLGVGASMPNFGGFGMGMYGTGTTSSSSYRGPGADIVPSFSTVIHHPGDLSLVVPCTGCGAMYDPCSFGGHCSYQPLGSLWPEALGLHATVNHADVTAYLPQGPMSCARGRADNPVGCVDAPGEWNIRTGIPSTSGPTSGTSR